MKIHRDDGVARRRNRDGFTLLEMVVAMTMLGVGVVALASLLRGSMVLSSGARDLAAASVYASGRMEEALLSPEPVEGEEQGDFSEGGTKYRWKLSTEILSGEEGEPPLLKYRFRVTVYWVDGREERSVALVSDRWEREKADAGA